MLRQLNILLMLVLGASLLLALATVTGASNLVSGDTHELTVKPSGQPITLAVNSKTDVDDGVCDTNHCTLREAINAANATAGTPETIAFDIFGLVPHTIQPSTPLPSIVEPLIIDGTTQPGYEGTPLIVLNGSISGGLGLSISAGNCIVRGLIINNFNTGISIRDAGNNVIQGNYIGTDASGASDLGNLYGVGIFDSSGNTVGGHTFDARNVISGNTLEGVRIQGANATGNFISGNFIGTDVSGAASVSNRWGVVILGAVGNIVGGTDDGARNVISGNDHYGIGLFAGIVDASDNLIQGNFIGTDVSGILPLGNGFNGVFIEDTGPNLVGGAEVSARNVISANGTGVLIRGAGAAGNVLQGNFIGTTVTGIDALGNLESGVRMNGAVGVLVGGTTRGSGNLISGNGSIGVHLSLGSSSNVIQGNFIGTDVTGSDLLGNGGGVRFEEASDNTLGGATSGAGNLISGNQFHGVEIIEFTATRNSVQGNLIGTDISGTLGLGNKGLGVGIFNAPNNAISGNVISGNGSHGVQIFGVKASANLVHGNLIGSDINGVDALGNTGHGIGIFEASGNLIGGTETISANHIVHNGIHGVLVESGSGNAIQSNVIFSNEFLGIELLQDGVTPNDVGDDDNGANNLQNFPILTSATSESITIEGILSSAPNTTFNLQFFSNSVCDASGYGEGETFIGAKDATTNSVGDARFLVTFPAMIPAGEFVTATATDPANNSSEFSRCQPILKSSDVNQDEVVNVDDLIVVRDKLGDSGDTSAEVNGDGLVDVLDLAEVAKNFGRIPGHALFEVALCQFEVPLGQNVDCGYLTVPEDRLKPLGPRIRLGSKE